MLDRRTRTKAEEILKEYYRKNQAKRDVSFLSSWAIAGVDGVARCVLSEFSAHFLLQSFRFTISLIV